MTSMTAALYCRISDDSLKSGVGVAEQERLCRQLCKQRGWTVLEPAFVDNDVSATKGKSRSRYEDMLKAVERGAVSVIVAYRDDRLLRRLQDCLKLIPLVIEHGTEICTVSQGHFDLNTAYGRKQALQSALDAQYETDRLAERVRVGMDRIAREGRVTGRGRSFGYQPVWVEIGKRRKIADLEIVPAEADEIVKAVRRILAGEPLRAIVRDWRERVPPVDGGRWANVNVKRVLTAARNAGLREHRTEYRDASGRRCRRRIPEIVGEATWPAIIDRETWERVCAVLLDPGRATPGGGPGPRKFATRGLAVCGKPKNHNPSEICGTRLISKPCAGREISNLVCPPSSDGGCGGVAARADGFEREVAEQVISVLVCGDGLARAMCLATQEDRTAATLAAQIREDTERLQRLEVAHHTKDELSRAGYLESRAILMQRIDKARAALSTNEAANALQGLPPTEDALRTWWNAESTSVDRRRAILDALIAPNGIILHPAKRASNRFMGGRVQILWRV